MNRETVTKFYLTYTLYIFPAVVALSSLILIIFVIYPQVSKLIANQKAEGDLKIRSAFLETKVQALESYDEDDLSRKVNYALNVYPAERDFANILGLVEAVTSKSGFSIVSANFGESSTKPSGSQSYVLKMEVLGSRSLLSLLLSNIEESGRIMKVQSIETSSSRDLQTANVILGVDILYAAVPGSFGTVDSPLPQFTQKDEEIIAKLAASAPQAVSLPVVPTTLGPRGKANPFE